MSYRESYVEGTPSWVELATTDLPGSKAFYGALLGWEFEENSIEDSDQTYTMAMRADRALAGMMSQQPEQIEMGLPPMWNTRVVRSSTSREHSYGPNFRQRMRWPP